MAGLEAQCREEALLCKVGVARGGGIQGFFQQSVRSGHGFGLGLWLRLRGGRGARQAQQVFDRTGFRFLGRHGGSRGLGGFCAEAEQVV